PERRPSARQLHRRTADPTTASRPALARNRITLSDFRQSAPSTRVTADMDANDNWLWASCWHPEQADLHADSPVCRGLAGLRPVVAGPALARVTLVGISVVGSGRGAGCCLRAGHRGGCCPGMAGSGAAGEQVLVGLEVGRGCGAGGELLCISPPWAGVGALAG